MVRWLLLLCLLVVACGRDDGTEPRPVDEKLPALKLTDDTPELLLTWIDDRGVTHTAVAIAEVPAEGRQMVRVITKTGGHGRLFYVADLSAKQPDGSYPVRTVPRTEWEAQIERRRALYQERHAPPPPPTASAREPAAVGLSAIVYGADWCKPCHAVVAYLKQRGVAVVEYDIDNDEGRAREMQQKLRQAGRMGGSIPVIDIGGQIVVGYNPRALDRALAGARGGTHL